MHKTDIPSRANAQNAGSIKWQQSPHAIRRDTVGSFLLKEADKLTQAAVTPDSCYKINYYIFIRKYWWILKQRPIENAQQITTQPDVL